MPFIQEAYPESTQVALIGLEQVNDAIIMQYAIDNGFAIATKDADFYEMNLVYGQPPKIIWLKMGNQSKAATINALLNYQVLITKALLDDDKDCIEIY